MKKSKRMASAVLVIGFVVAAVSSAGLMPGRVNAHPVLGCTHQSPNVVVAPDGLLSFGAGGDGFTTVTVTNLDEEGCDASSFDLQPTAPEGWTATLDDAQLVINPGESASTTLRITSPEMVDEGIYQFEVTAQNSLDANCIDVSTGSFAVATSLDVTLPAEQTVTTGTLLPIMAEVRALGILVGGAEMSFDIICPDEQVLHYDLETGQDGAAGIKLRLEDDAPLGTYMVKASAGIKGAVGSSVTSFTVEAPARRVE